MNRIISLVILGLFLIVTVNTSFAAAAWCGYNKNATTAYSNNQNMKQRRNQIQDSLSACEMVMAPGAIRNQLGQWVSDCDAAQKSGSTKESQDNCKKDYECIKLQTTGNPCFIPGYQPNGACGVSMNTWFHLGVGCELCPAATPLLNKTTLECEVCPTTTPFYNTSTFSCVSCDATTPFWDASSNSCKACTGTTPKYDATTNTCVASGCTSTKPFYNETTKACEACPSTTPLYTASSNKCSACPNGTTYDTTKQSCVTSTSNTGTGSTGGTGTGGTGTGGTGTGGTGTGGTGSGGTGTGGTGSGGTGTGGTGSGSTGTGSTGSGSTSPSNPSLTKARCTATFPTLTSVYAMKVEMDHLRNQLRICRIACPGGTTVDSLNQKLGTLNACCKILNNGTDC